jgi:hypothetical protein
VMTRFDQVLSSATSHAQEIKTSLDSLHVDSPPTTNNDAPDLTASAEA